ncbi:MAG: hypothetical protein GY937_19960 [bacterium]|nr:hypothetical protein [bacterium]
MSRKIIHIALSPHAGYPWVLQEILNTYTNDEHILVAGRCEEADGRTFPKPEEALGKIHLWDKVDRLLYDQADAFILHGNGPHLRMDVGWEDGVFDEKDDRPKAWLVYEPYWGWQPWSWGPFKNRRLATFLGLKSQIWDQAMDVPVSRIPYLVQLQEWKPFNERAQVVSTSFAVRGFTDYIGAKGVPIIRKGFEHAQKEVTSDEGANGWKLEELEKEPLWEAIEKKRSVQVGVDEVVTGGFHRSGLEYMAAGCVVIHGLTENVEYQIRKAFVEKDFTCERMPTMRLIAKNFRYELAKILQWNPKELEEIGTKCHKWVSDMWHPGRLTEAFYLPLLT